MRIHGVREGLDNLVVAGEYCRAMKSTRLVILVSERDIKILDKLVEAYGLPGRSSAVRMLIRREGGAAMGKRSKK